MKRKNEAYFCLIIFLAVFSVLTTVHSAIAETVDALDYFPLETDMTWTYLEDGLNPFTLAVLPGTESVNGVATKVVKQSGGEENGSTTNYSNDENGIRDHKEYSPDVFIEGLGFRDITVALTPPMKFSEAAGAIGDVVNSSGTAYFTISGLGTFPMSYVSTSKFAKFENVSVPFGDVKAVKIQNALTISGFVYTEYIETTATRTLWLTRYVGVVKSITVVDGASSTSELVSTSFEPFLSADFTAEPTSGVSPQTVTFTDRSDGNISAWSWDFGDGSTSTLQHPAHTYDAKGVYTVTLTVSGLGVSDSETKTDYIDIAPDPSNRNDPNQRAMPWIPLLLEE